jgi:hypothetical protein
MWMIFSVFDSRVFLSTKSGGRIPQCLICPRVSEQQAGSDLGVGALWKAADFLDVSPRMKACRVRANFDCPRWRSDVRWNGGRREELDALVAQTASRLSENGRWRSMSPCRLISCRIKQLLKTNSVSLHFRDPVSLPPLPLLPDDTRSTLEDGIDFI